MEQFFVLILVGLTSIGAYLLGAKRLGLLWRHLRVAIGRMLECIGMALVFFLVNLAAGMAIVLAGRLLTRGFVSLYLANDVSLVMLSFLQALAFQWWRELKAQNPPRSQSA